MHVLRKVCTPYSLTTILAGLSLLSLRAAGPTPVSPALVPMDALIRRVEDRYNHVRTLSLAFTEEYSIQGHRRRPESGTLVLRKPGRMRWDYTTPAGKLFVSDGKTVYLYTAADNRVEKSPLKASSDLRAPMAFLLGKLELKKELQNFSARLADGGTWLEGEAKNDRVPYEKVSMLIAADGSITRLQVNGRDQSVLSFAFQKEVLNPPVKDSLFAFQMPMGAEIVDASAMTPEEH